MTRRDLHYRLTVLLVVAIGTVYTAGYALDYCYIEHGEWLWIPVVWIGLTTNLPWSIVAGIVFLCSIAVSAIVGVLLIRWCFVPRGFTD